METVRISRVPCSPSTPISTDIKKVNKVILSHGATERPETIYPETMKKVDGMFVLECGRQINPDFIISREQKQIVTVVTDSTAHSNYYDRECNSSTRTTKFLIGAKDKVQFVDVVNFNTNAQQIEDTTKKF